MPCCAVVCAGQCPWLVGQPADCAVGGQWLEAHQHGRPAGPQTGTLGLGSVEVGTEVEVEKEEVIRVRYDAV